MLRHRLESLFPSSAAIFALAVLLGVATGYVAIGFRLMIEGARWVFYTGPPWAPTGVLGDLGWVLIPAAGGALVGPLLYLWARRPWGHGFAEIMEAVSLGSSRLRFWVSMVKTVASSITLGSGGSAGREGPIAQTGSAVGAAFAQVLRLPRRTTRTLTAAGAAGGVAATFNTPLAGAFVALEVILRDWSSASFAPVVIAAFCGTVVSRHYLGDHPAFDIPPYTVDTWTELPMFAVLGLACALAATAFIAAMNFTDQFAQRIPLPQWGRPLLGGLIVGALGLLALKLGGGYERIGFGVLGVGYDTISRVFVGELWSPKLLVLLLMLKIVATSVTLGFGGSGGVVGPCLFMGCMAGACLGGFIHQLDLGLVSTPQSYALAGMGAVFAAAGRAPVTSVLMVYEMTHDHRMILPVMFACAVAVWAANGLCRFSIFNYALVRRGVHLDLPYEVALLSEITVQEAMTTDLLTVRPQDTVTDVMALLDNTKHHGFPVADDNGRLHGIVTLSDVRHAMAKGNASATAEEIATHDVVVAYPDESLNDALRKLALRDIGRLPVVDRADVTRLLGLITRKNILSAYNLALMRRHTDLDKTVDSKHME